MKSRAMGTIVVIALGATVSSAMLWAASPARATVMVEVPMDQMVREAVAIVHARVVNSGVQLVIRDDSLDPHTVTSLEVLEWIRGEGPASIDLREMGGETRLGGMRIDGTPRYSLGEEVVLFLQRDPEAPDRFFRTLHMVQGKFVVRHGAPGVDAVVRRDMSAVAFARRGRWGMDLRHGTANSMRLADFLQRLREAPRTPGATGAEISEGGQ